MAGDSKLCMLALLVFRLTDKPSEAALPPLPARARGDIISQRWGAPQQHQHQSHRTAPTTL